MLRDIFDSYRTSDKYLILGKGPTLDQLGTLDTTGYQTVSLNHVVREHPVHLAHTIDLEVVDQVGEKILTNCDYLVMPYIPHLGHRPTDMTLEELANRHPIISKMAQEDRLFGYNLSTSMRKVGSTPVVKARHYSAEAVVDLLAKLGVKHIRTLGVDGGANQSQKFSDLKNYNTQRGYDLQWTGIRKTIQRWNVDYAPLGVESPIRIFIGAGDAQLIPALVLKHSILKHATMSVDVTIMNTWTHPMPKDKRNWPRTPFSFQRFMIPEKCNYQGHAIYMDSDMLVFGDVKDIWQAPMEDSVLCMRGSDTDKHRAQGSVFKVDCSDIPQWKISSLVNALDKGAITYDWLVFDQWNMAPNGWNPNWNSLEEYIPGQTKLLHYTEMYNQPWLRNPSHPLGHLWFSELREAVSDGSIDRTLVTDHVAKGYILPVCQQKLDRT